MSFSGNLAASPLGVRRRKQIQARSICCTTRRSSSEMTRLSNVLVSAWRLASATAPTGASVKGSAQRNLGCRGRKLRSLMINKHVVYKECLRTASQCVYVVLGYIFNKVRSMSFKTEYHVDVSFLHDLTTGGPTNKSAEEAADEAAERRKEFLRLTQKALSEGINPSTGARMNKRTINKMNGDMTLYNEMQKTLLTGRDPNTEEEQTQEQIKDLKLKIKRMEARQRRNKFRNSSEIWDDVLKNCNESKFDEWTLGKILEAANIVPGDKSPWDIFTIIWNSLQPDSKKIVSNFLVTKGMKNPYRYSQIRL